MRTRIAGRDFILPDGVPDLHGLFTNEEPVREAFWRVSSGDVVFDVGSSMGSYTIPALIAGAAVYAIDPFSKYTSQISAMCQDNQLDMTRLIIVNEALAGPGGYPEDLWTALAAAPWQEIYAHRDHTFTTLDDLTARLGITRLDWVKIDVEGAEFEVLRGGLETLRRFRPRLLIEDHSDVYAFVRDMEISRHCRELLDGLGYSTEVVRYADDRGSALDRDFWVCS